MVDAGIQSEIGGQCSQHRIDVWEDSIEKRGKPSQSGSEVGS